MTNTGNKRGDITPDPMDIKCIIKEYCEQLYAHKFDNLYEMDQFLKDTFAKTHIRTIDWAYIY